MTEVKNLNSFINLFIYVSRFPMISFALISYLSIHTPYHLHCTWLGSTKGYTEDLSYGFLIEWWAVHSQFMNLSNPSKTIVHYLLLRVMTYHSRLDDFLMMSAYDANWTEPTNNHDIRLSIVIIHQATILHEPSTLKGY